MATVLDGEHHYRPLRDYVLVLLDLAPTTWHGLMLPDRDEAQVTGTVLAVGPHVTELKPGDHVLFEAASGMPLDAEVVAMPEDRVLAVLEDAHA